MPSSSRISTVIEISQHLHNWLYNVENKLNISTLLHQLFPESKKYINEYDGNSEFDKLNLLLDLRQYIEFEIFEFDPININPFWSVIALQDQVNIEINQRLYVMRALQEQQIHIQHIIAQFVLQHSRGLEVSIATMQRLQDTALLISSKSNSSIENTYQKLLVVCSELLLIRLLLWVYNQQMHYNVALKPCYDLHVIIANVRNKAAKDPTIITTEFLMLAKLCWDLWQLDILEYCINSGMRLPGNEYLTSYLQILTDNGDIYSKSIIERLTDDFEVAQVINAPAEVAIQKEAITETQVTIETTPTEKINAAILQLNGSEFNRLIKINSYLLETSSKKLQQLVSSSKKESKKQTNKVHTFINAIKLPLELCTELFLVATDEKTISIISAKIDAHNSNLQKQFNEYLNNKVLTMPAQFQEIIITELHKSIIANDLNRVQLLIKKGANPNLKNHTNQSANNIILERLENSSKVDSTTMAIAEALGIIRLKSYENKTSLHVWAQTTPNDTALLKILLKTCNDSNQNLKQELDQEYGDNFVHTLFRNKNVNESAAMHALKVIFEIPSLYLNQLILATKNNNGNTVLGVSEIRGWQKVSSFIGEQLVTLLKNLVRQQVDIKNYFKHALDYFNNNSPRNIIALKLRNEDYQSIQQLIELREMVRCNLKDISKIVGLKDRSKFYSILYSIFGDCEYSEINIGDMSLVNYLNYLYDTGNIDATILKIVNSPLIKKLIANLPLTSLVYWKKAIQICSEHGVNEECIKNLDLLTSHSHTSKIDPNKIDINNATMLDYAAALGDINLIREIIQRFNFTIKPKTLLHACASFQNNDQTLEYLFKLYEIQCVNNSELPSIIDLNNSLELDLLNLAILKSRNVSKIRWLQKYGCPSNKIYMYKLNLLQRVIVNTGYGEKSAQLDFSYSLEVIKQLLTQDENTNKIMVTNRDEYGSTVLEQTLSLQLKSAAEHETLITILELLISKGADLTNLSNDGQNILHYVAEFGDQPRTKYILNKIQDIHGKEQVERMQQQMNNNGMTPLMLVSHRIKIEEAELQKNKLRLKLKI